MAGVSKEQIEQAKQMDLLTYLQMVSPQELVRVGQTTYCTKTHDSLRISENGLWNWCSQGIGGKDALKYLIHVKGCGFVEAVQKIRQIQQGGIVLPKQETGTVLPKERILNLPQKDANAAAMKAYLTKRGIHSQVIEYCIEHGFLYQTTQKGYRSCVFVGQDESGKPRYACIRNCGGNFRGDAMGSDKRYGCYIPATLEKAKVVEVYESPIDAMSGASLRMLAGRSNWRSVHYLSLGGLSYPALEHFLQNHSEIQTVRLCLDRDEPGRAFAQKLQDRYAKEARSVEIRLPKNGKDYNDVLLHYCAAQKQQFR